jgi:hypothetical protein
MVMVAEHLEELLQKEGYPSRVTTHSVWDNFSAPPPANLVLQLLPAFTEAETGCPVITIKPMIADYDHAETLAKIFARVRLDYPAVAAPRPALA